MEWEYMREWKERVCVWGVRERQRKNVHEAKNDGEMREWGS